MIIDVDRRNGGAAALGRLEEQHGPMPATVRVRTGGGGLHFLYAHPGGGPLRGGPGRLGPGVDVLADGHFAVGVGSRHASGGIYTWDPASHPETLPVAPLPPWVLKQLAGPRRPQRRRRSYAVIREGDRNHALASLAGRMLLGGTHPEAVAAALQVHNRVCCHPPLRRAEVEAIARSAAKWTAPPAWLIDPVGFAADAGLTPAEQWTLMHLARHADNEGRCHPGYRRLAERSSTSKNRIGAMVDALERLGRIEVTRRPRAVNRYRLIDLDDPSQTLRGKQRW